MIPETKMLSRSDSVSKCGNQLLGGTGKWNFKWWVKKPSATSKKQNPSKVVGGTWLKRLLFLCVVASIMGSLCIFHYMNAGIVKRREDLLKSMCDERTRMLVDQFNVSMNHIHALALLVSTFHLRKQPSSIDQETFANFAEQTAFERPLTTGVSYAQRVLHSEREQFEKEQGWQILKMPKECNDSLDPCESEYEIAPVQDEYAPVIFSQRTVQKIHKCDVMSGKEDRDNVFRAKESGKGVLTHPFKLASGNLGVILTFPVYKTDVPPDATPEERIEAIAGYLGGSFDVEQLVISLLGQLAGNQTIEVNVYDTTDKSNPIKMYGKNITENGQNITQNGQSHVSELNFGDPMRRHEMVCRFAEEPPLPWSAIMMSFGVLLISMLFLHIFDAALNRIAKVEEDFRKMEELKVRAEAADVAKSQFLATVSHEIRTPMNGVLGMLGLLMETELDATQKDYARTAQTSGDSLITLINEVLDQAKIESGRLELEEVPFRLRSILDDVLSLFSGKSQEKGIELAVFVSNQVPEILIGDPVRFRQIVTNLVSNSIKFTERGHIFVCVHLVEQLKLVEVNSEASKRYTEIVKNGSKNLWDTLSGYETADGRNRWENLKLLQSDETHELPEASSQTSEAINLCVSVEDTGVGIPLKAQERVFIPFMQADSSTSRQYGGTGIGLSISRRLVELMSGKIDFVSKPHVGSTFTFTAIFKKGRACRPDMSEAITNFFKGMKALVVDVKAVRAAVTKYHLQRLGVQVEIATEHESAIVTVNGGQNGDVRSSATGNINIMLVDKEAWSTGTGLIISKVLKEMRQNYRISEFPKMILTATSINSEESKEVKAAGFLETVIMKPLRASMVAACLQQALGGEGNRKAPIPSLKGLLSDKQILVVDDNMVNRRVAEGALKKYGAKVECVASGKAALEKLQPPHNFDACFMDVQMPEMDGFEATKRVRNLEYAYNSEPSREEHGNARNFHVPILAMTADVIQATHEKCLRCGMDGYVSKPFEEEQLYRAVAQFFKSEHNSLDLRQGL
ncbi:probable histidine kinase 6 [Cryptomeria japonica]|uniref:probable histidine kinase 6 n=1 Tax=Cryptomeria japonica TaxID=3369 RepID=UPI0025AC6248|nr:probable histidine kinase 6 [Cryptomeria japonica]